MEAKEIANVLRKAKGAGLVSPETAASQEFDAFIAALDRVGNTQISALINRFPKPRTTNTGRSDQSASKAVSNVVDALNRLKNQVLNWEEPDYERVRSIVVTECDGLKVAELREVSLQFLGSKNSKSNKQQLLELLSEPMRKRLRLKFMNVST